MAIQDEYEVKVLGMDLKELEDRLRCLGARRISEERQKNILILSDNCSPLPPDSYLRIREADDGVENRKEFTFKKKESDDVVRKNVEITTRVDDIEALRQILCHMGYNRQEVGYKHRISYAYKDARCDLDCWDEETYPFSYMEIEVPKESSLKEILNDLEIPEECVTLKSIEQLRKEYEQSRSKK